MAHALTAKELWTRAQNGEKIATKERRHVLEWLQVMGDTSYTNVDLGKIFGVTERMIRVDRKKVREDAVKALSENKDINFVIADIFQDFEKQRADLERNKKHARDGSPTYNQACKMIFEMRVQMLKLLQDFGWLPKNIAASHTASYVHIAVVNTSDQTVATETIQDTVRVQEIVDKLHSDGGSTYNYKALIQAPKESDDGDSSIGAV
jgi:hypothetical protein